jgi:signal transduction histidine kinase
MFGLGALLFSASMGSISYVIVRHVLVGEQENASLHQAYLNAESVRNALLTVEQTATTTRSTPIYDIVDAADSGTTTSNSVLLYHRQWYPHYISYQQNAIPPRLRNLVEGGSAGSQTYVLGHSPVITVGIPLPSAHAAYFELFTELRLSHTLRVLLITLLGAGAFTTVLGAAVGRWASGGSLRPLTGVSRAAVAIARGRIDTRLAAMPGDPDLEGLTSSFNAMVDQLQERIEREARFTSDVSHELRSPLTTMAASLDVLEGHSEELSPTGRRALGLLSADLRRFERMVGELLEISRSDTGSADVSLEEVDPGELARRSVAAATRSLPPDVAVPRVEIDPSIDGARLTVDKRRFERVMTNLIENAAFYGGGATVVRVEPGTNGLPGETKDAVKGPAHRRIAGRAVHPLRPTPRVAVPAARLPTVVFSVEDHGPGVAPAERTRVFQRFYRGQVSGQRGSGHGTGLGLALVAEHVRLHGGRVWVDEAPGGGARFCVELPVLAHDPEHDEGTEHGL